MGGAERTPSPFHSGESRNLILATARIFREAEWSPVGECGCRRRDSGFRRNGRGMLVGCFGRAVAASSDVCISALILFRPCNRLHSTGEFSQRDNVVDLPAATMRIIPVGAFVNFMDFATMFDDSISWCWHDDFSSVLIKNNAKIIPRNSYNCEL